MFGSSGVISPPAADMQIRAESPRYERAGAVVHLTTVHAPSDTRIFFKECRSLAQAGMDVTMVVPAEKAGVVHSVRIEPLPRPRARLSRMTRTVWSAFWKALRLKAGLYHLHDPELLPVGLLLRAWGKHVIYDVHEDVPKDVLSKPYLPLWSREIVGRAAKLAEDVAVGYLSAVVAATPSIYKRFHTMNTRTVMVRNFPIPEELSNGHSMLWCKRDSAVAYIGGITGLRGIREMIRAMGLLPDALDAKLEIAGNATYGDSLDDLPTLPGWNRVCYRGYLDGAGIAELLGRVRAGLVLFHPAPNHVEAMPMKLFEYMAAGIPVIASTFPAWREIVEEARCGLLVDPLKPQEIAEAMQYLLMHPNEAEEMGRRGMRAVQETYNWKTQARVLLDLYSELFAGSFP